MEGYSFSQATLEDAQFLRLLLRFEWPYQWIVTLITVKNLIHVSISTYSKITQWYIHMHMHICVYIISHSLAIMWDEMLNFKEQFLACFILHTEEGHWISESLFFTPIPWQSVTIKFKPKRRWALNSDPNANRTLLSDVSRSTDCLGGHQCWLLWVALPSWPSRP